VSIIFADFHNLIIRKLNAVLLNLTTIDERLIKLDNHIRKNEETDLKKNEHYDFDLPADTVEQLQRIDNQLKNKCVATEMVYTKYYHFILTIRNILLKCLIKSNILDIFIYLYNVK